MELLQGLLAQTGRNVKLRINDNRSTMISVRWHPLEVRLSLHRMFLYAPEEVLQALLHYIRAGKNAAFPPEIRLFLQEGTAHLDYKHRLDPEALICKGVHYDLKTFYDEVNKNYFDSSLDLSITWYGSQKRRFRSTVTFGLYSDPLKLVKIHRLLDSPDVPPYFLDFIVYHEMLHSVCRPKGGRIHTREFRQREKQHRYYFLSERWIQENKHKYF
ncbi:MAG: hypothetical protein KDK48_02820 [Chlamydiia bacterium]|nr:hypothetical protein [Chlamydiia bacterium]